MMTVASAVVTSFSTNQKIDVKSSTETGLIRMDYVILQILWTGYFMECQGNKIEENIVFSGNESTISF